MSSLDRVKLLSSLPQIETIAEAAYVPVLMLLVMWKLNGGLRHYNTSQSGPFGIRPEYWTQARTYVCLSEMTSLSTTTVDRFCVMETKSFILNGILAALEVRLAAQVGIYPDMDSRAIQSLLEAFYAVYKPEFVPDIPETLKELEEVLESVRRIQEEEKRSGHHPRRT